MQKILFSMKLFKQFAYGSRFNNCRNKPSSLFLFDVKTVIKHENYQLFKLQFSKF